jgi:hypothetical protein
LTNCGESSGRRDGSLTRYGSPGSNSSSRNSAATMTVAAMEMKAFSA